MELTLSFFSRVSPLVILQAGGAGAPDLGGLLFRVVAVVASGRPARAARGGAALGSSATYPIFFRNLP